MSEQKCPSCGENFELEDGLDFDTEDFPCPACGKILTIEVEESYDGEDESVWIHLSVA